MHKILLSILGIFIIGALIALSTGFKLGTQTSGAPPYYVEEEQPPGNLFDEYSYLKDWKRPDGPARVGLQVGHWKNEEIPDELHRLRGNTGAVGGGKSEWEVNLEIAEQTKTILEKSGVAVDIIPATIPVDYLADIFVAIHADGSEDPTKTGFKAATPRRDLSGKAGKLLQYIEDSYEKSTGLKIDPNVTRNMRGYYAFSYWRYDHAVHPMTTALILETGFLTSPGDRRIIADQPELSAQGLSDGIIKFLNDEGLLSQAINE